MKEVYRNDDVVAYSGFRDAFGGKMYVVINTTLNELRLYGKNPYYQKERKRLDNMKCQHVIVPEYLSVIDVTAKIKKKIEDIFPGYVHSEWQVTA